MTIGLHTIVITGFWVVFHDPLAAQVLANQTPGAVRQTSESLVVDSALDPSGGPVASSATYTLKPGFIGQLFEVVSLEVTAQDPVIDEGESSQLTASTVLDDDSVMRPEPAELAWTIVSGPVVSISVDGLATSGLVGVDRVATVRGGALGKQDETTISILDVLRDNYGPVAGDGIEDVWQISYFDQNFDDELDGAEAALAAPEANPDGDSFNNLFEWITGYDPLDSGEFFKFSIVAQSGSTTTMTLSKVIAGTSYVILGSPNLEPFGNGNQPVEIATLNPVVDGVEVIVQDSGATPNDRFYRIRMERTP